MKPAIILILFLLISIVSNIFPCSAQNYVDIDIKMGGGMQNVNLFGQNLFLRDVKIDIDVATAFLCCTIKNTELQTSRISTNPLMDYDDFCAMFACDIIDPNKRPGFSISKRTHWEEVTLPEFRDLNLFWNESFCKSTPIWNLSFWNKQNFPENLSKEAVYRISSTFCTTATDNTGNSSSLLSTPSTILLSKQIGLLCTLQKKTLQSKNKNSNTVTKPFPVIPAKPSTRLSLNKTTGNLMISISNEADIKEFHIVRPVRINVDAHFGCYQQESVFFSRFYASSQRTKQRYEVPHIPFTGKIERIFELDGNETITKECKIWELSIWQQLVEAIKANRTENFTIQYPVRVELVNKFDGVPENAEGFSTVKHEETAELIIDYRTMLQMEKLREAVK